ncbi:hypothetical protein NLM33_18890 [Bradyrhizobium sp. CCGUVB1N3]|uniref:hypothetical protein n=1 Tax=Bradyrhizobium sp. CCGUVB1N3 TaxID=2949629 RepID=UPI0020B19C38|nr:hypothetical protein [Bradyrhizobium sp. CCGUVB1N3]MCP3471445.1 hypothetical protein [Bradyrhizobium sp. CCGUVB1N3]MCP3472385.1 hypothetical protein [Bradyrhizobium sp. CCGUVB1N3]
MSDPRDDDPEVHSPPNELRRIDAVWAFISSDETGEGLCAAPLMGPGTLIPLIAADEERLKLCLPWARWIAAMSGKTIKLIKLSQRAEIMEIGPDGETMQ